MLLLIRYKTHIGENDQISEKNVCKKYESQLRYDYAERNRLRSMPYLKKHIETYLISTK